jgi:hypothetical protein
VRGFDSWSWSWRLQDRDVVLNEGASEEGMALVSCGGQRIPCWCVCVYDWIDALNDCFE